MPFVGSLLALAISFLLAPLLIRLAKATGAVDFSRHTPLATPPVPRIGGVLLFAAVAATLLLLFPWLPDAGNDAEFMEQRVVAFVVGAVLILLIGVVDDIYGLRARWKLLGQIAVAALAWWIGLRVEVITNLMDPANPIQLGLWSFPLSILWTVICVNAMNIIDGVDGLAGGVFGLAIALLLVICLYMGSTLLATVSAILLGATAAFLALNLRKKLYLGDGGSMLLGFTLACIVPFSYPKSAGLASVMIPLGVLSVPISEVFVTTLRRILQGKPIGQPDHGHLHHRLSDLGLSSQRITVVINTICFLCGLLALGMTLTLQAKLAAFLGFCWLALLLLLFGMGYRSMPGQHKNATGNAIFLDHERLVQRMLSNIPKCKTPGDLRDMVDEFSRLIEVRDLRLTMRQPRDAEQDELDPTDVHPASGCSLNVYRTAANGCRIELTTLLELADEGMDLNKVGFYIHSLGAAIGKWVDAQPGDVAAMEAEPNKNTPIG